VPRLRRGVHRPAAAALRSGSGVGVAGRVALPRLRWPGGCQPAGCWGGPQLSSRDCPGGGLHGLNLAALVIKLLGQLGVAFLWADRLPHSGSSHLMVYLYC
jgi:hypothetical protein